jgi:hypothetical protein
VAAARRVILVNGNAMNAEAKRIPIVSEGGGAAASVSERK